MYTYNESCIDHYGGNEQCGVSTGERALKNRLSKLLEEYPDKVTMVAENPDGSVYYRVPWSWIKIKPPRSSNLTDQQRDAMRERARLNFKLDESS